MPLLRLDNISVHFGAQVILDSTSLSIKKGDKFGLLGRNGAGKSTLMKVIDGSIDADGGERWARSGIEVVSLDQSLPEATQDSVFDWVAGGLAEVGELLKQYHHLTANFEQSNLKQLERVQQQLELKDGWRISQKVDTVLTQLELQADKKMNELSGGWRKRVALARALVREPDILLLDEPTNHLDIPAIEHLEKFLQDFRGALVLVTHDRSFLQNIANHIVELDRGRLYAFEGSYQHFLRYREQQLAAEQRANELFDKKLAQEEVWIRQGIKARRTRNEGRVRALKAMRGEHRQRRQQQGKANIQLDSAQKSGKIVVEVKNVSHSFDNAEVIRDFSTVVLSGDRIGVVGANGVGKSTLLKILLGTLTPDQGQVKLGSKLEVAYFDQLREHLDLEKNLIDNVCGGREFIEIDGKKKHAIGYLGDFLFTPESVFAPAKSLSGGEQNRAILAKIFSQPANVLVLDEPTNDLDIETLELLEDILLNFKGTVLLVSHDRNFMDNVVTSLMVFEGQAKVTEHVGGYSDWLAGGGSLYEQQEKNRRVTPTTKPRTATSKPEKSRENKKLSYNEKRELELLPSTIEYLEKQQAEFEELMADSDFYSKDPQQADKTLKLFAEVQAGLTKAYQRWEELESER